MRDDFYDDPQPVELWAEVSDDDVRDFLLYCKIVAVPTALYIAISIFNKWIDKRLESL